MLDGARYRAVMDYSRTIYIVDREYKMAFTFTPGSPIDPKLQRLLETADPLVNDLARRSMAH